MDSHIWKDRFVAALAERFRDKGLSAQDALADAQAHADDHYPHRGPGSPEEEAEAVLKSLAAQ